MALTHQTEKRLSGAVLTSWEKNGVEPGIAEVVSEAEAVMMWKNYGPHRQSYVEYATRSLKPLPETPLTMGRAYAHLNGNWALYRQGAHLNGVVTDKGIISRLCHQRRRPVCRRNRRAGRRPVLHHSSAPGTLVILDKRLAKPPTSFIGTPPKNFTKGGGPTQTPRATHCGAPQPSRCQKDDLAVDEEDVRFVMEKGKHLTEAPPKGILSPIQRLPGIELLRIYHRSV